MTWQTSSKAWEDVVTGVMEADAGQLLNNLVEDVVVAVVIVHQTILLEVNNILYHGDLGKDERLPKLTILLFPSDVHHLLQVKELHTVEPMECLQYLWIVLPRKENSPISLSEKVSPTSGQEVRSTMDRGASPGRVVVQPPSTGGARVSPTMLREMRTVWQSLSRVFQALMTLLATIENQ